MRLQFDEDEEDEYFATRDVLVEEIEESLRSDRPGSVDAAEIAGSISVLLDWRWNYSSGQLDDWSRLDVEEFLLDWLPRKYSAPPEAGAEMCSAVADFFVHMGARERLVGGVDRAAALVARAYELSDTVVERMGDPANFGMAKSMFGSPLAGDAVNPLADLGALIESGVDTQSPEFQALMQERMDAFNALSVEDRKAVTDVAVRSAVPATQRIKIPVVDVPPTLDEVERSIADSRLLTMIDALVDFVGPKGIAVTQTGNLRLADARELVTLLGTDDVFDRVLPWHDEPEPVRTSADLVQLTLVFDVAEAAGAFTRLKTKVKVDPAWLDRPVVERAQLAVDGLVDIGPISSSVQYEIFWQIASLLEDGLPHWLAMGLPQGAEIRTEPFVGQATDLLEGYLPDRPSLLMEPNSLERTTARQVFALFGVLDFAGILDWCDRVEVTSEFGHTFETDGWFRLTPLGRRTMVHHIREAGYDFESVADLGDATADALINVLLTTDAEPADFLPRWRPDASTADRATDLAAAAMAADLADQRLVAMDLLGLLEPIHEVEPAVRQMLDSACAGHATLFLLGRGLATPDEVGAFIDVGPVVDMFSTMLDTPTVLADLFAEMHVASVDDLFEDLWRHDRSETIDVLDSLGKHLSDKKLAKAARKAAVKHRSWMANLHR